jgi:ESCRT-I complex subunit TSG101
MAGVPEKVLNWLYSVLTSVFTTIALWVLDANDATKEYKDVNRTYHDAAEALSHYPSLSPRTEVYSTSPPRPQQLASSPQTAAHSISL